MFGQSFQTADIASIAALVVLEALLSADNALVLAIMVKHLPPDLRKKALLYGLGGAFVFRLVAILLAKYVLGFWWLQGIGAAYLLYLPIKHFIAQSKDKEAKPVGAGFWPTVIAVETTDIAFAVDSVLAGVTFIDNRHDKLWVVYFGAIIGIILLRFAAGLFVRLLERFPALDHVAYVLVGWVGVKLAFLTANSYSEVHKEIGHIPEMHPAIFWSVLLVIGAVGTLFAIRTGNKVADEEDCADMQDAQDMKIERKPKP